MKREEFVEDMSIGDVIFLRTATGESLVGEVLSLDETSVKIRRQGSDKPKRISYDSIAEFDFDVDEAMAASVRSSEDSAAMAQALAEQAAAVQALADKAAAAQAAAEEAAKEAGAAAAVAKENPTAVPLSSASEEPPIPFYREVFNGLEKEQKKLFNNIINILDNAKKIHEFTTDNDKVRSAISRLRQVDNGGEISTRLIAGILAELGDAESARSLLIEKGVLEAPVEKAEEPASETPKTPKVLTGNVLSFFPEKAYGFIRNPNGNQFFHLHQVMDQELQRILQQNNKLRISVDYIVARDPSDGKTKADRVVRTNPEDCGDAPADTRVGGFITSFYPDTRFGKIDSGLHKYNFILDNLVDPILRAELMAWNRQVDRNVSFVIGRALNGKDIADRVIAMDDYSGEQIEDLISSGNLSREVYEQWVNGGRAEAFAAPEEHREVKFFEYIALEPILEENTAELKASSRGPVGGLGKNLGLLGLDETTAPLSEARTLTGNPQRQEAESIDYSKPFLQDLDEEEKKAVKLLMDMTLPNPFRELESIPKGDYYQRAIAQSERIKNLPDDKAREALLQQEELFIKALQSGDNEDKCVSNLVASVYLRLGGDYITKALQLLDAYAYYMSTSKKRMDLLFQVVDRSGNEQAQEILLKYRIRTYEKTGQLLDYHSRLGNLYQKQKRWKEAIEAGQDLIDLIQRNPVVFPADKFRGRLVSANRLLALSYWHLGDRENANAYAKQVLEWIPKDLIALSILNREMEQSVPDEELTDEVLVEESYFVTEENTLPRYMQDCLDNVDYAGLAKFEARERLDKELGRYQGSANEAKEDINFILDNIRRTRTLLPEERSRYLFICARMALDSRRRVSAAGSATISYENVQIYAGRAMSYLADAHLLKNTNADSVRYLYALALRHMGAMDETNINKSVNNMFLSLLWDRENLKNWQTGNHFSSFFDKKLREMIGLKGADFAMPMLLCICDIWDRQQYVSRIANLLFSHTGIRQKLLFEIGRILGETYGKVEDEIPFRSILGEACGRIKRIHGQLTDCVARAAKEVDMDENFGRVIAEIKALYAVNTLTGFDDAVLNEYIGILQTLNEVHRVYSIVEKESRFRESISRLNLLHTRLSNEPTEFGYETILPQVNNLLVNTMEKYDDLYQGSDPKIDRIELMTSSISFDEKTKHAMVTVGCHNEQDRQTADGVSIEVSGNQIHALTFMKDFTSIRGGETQEFVVVLALEDAVIEKKQFDILVKLSYSYRSGVEQTQPGSASRVLPVSLKSREELQELFVGLENKYAPLIHGTGITTDEPEMFKGRENLVERVCNSMRYTNGSMVKNRGIVLWGQRRVGKNSVANYLLKRIKDTYGDAYIIIEIGSIGTHQNLAGVYSSFISETRNELLFNYPDLYDELEKTEENPKGVDFDLDEQVLESANPMSLFDKFMSSFARNMKKYTEQDKYIPLFFIDEFSYIYTWGEQGKLDGEAFMKDWKGMLTKYDICTLIIAQDNLPVWKAKYTNEFACMNTENQITFLDAKGARELICDPVQINGHALFTTESADLIFDLTLGSAYLIDIFCSSIVEYAKENFLESITRSIVELVLENELMERDGVFQDEDLFEPQLVDATLVDEESAHANQASIELLEEIAEKTMSEAQTQVRGLRFLQGEDEATGRYRSSIYDRLISRGIIENNAEGYVNIAMPLLKFYMLQRRHLLSREILSSYFRR